MALSFGYWYRTGYGHTLTNGGWGNILLLEIPLPPLYFLIKKMKSNSTLKRTWPHYVWQSKSLLSNLMHFDNEIQKLQNLISPAKWGSKWISKSHETKTYLTFLYKTWENIFDTKPENSNLYTMKNLEFIVNMLTAKWIL